MLMIRLALPKKPPVPLKRTPKTIKTIEKPSTNNRVRENIRDRETLRSVSSLKETPPIKERYEGIRGSMHGDKKDSTPAAKAINKLIFSVIIVLSWLIFPLYQRYGI
jgi:hypothetical protein